MYKTKMHSKVWSKVHSNLRFGFKNYSALVGRMVNKEISISFQKQTCDKLKNYLKVSFLERSVPSGQVLYYQDLMKL